MHEMLLPLACFVSNNESVQQLCRIEQPDLPCREALHHRRPSAVPAFIL